MGSKKAEDPKPVANPTDQADSIYQAKLKYDPLAAQQSYDMLANPNSGLLPTTQLFENVRQQVFPQESQVRNQLAMNILQNLVSPTGISPDQQAGITARRGEAQNNLVDAYRTRANLGGGLFGGRAAQEETRAVGELQNQFAEEDIQREERTRLNAIQAAMPFLQILYPEVGLSSPQFQSAVQSPDSYNSSLVTQRGQDLQNQQAADANRTALYSALFSAAGQGAGAFAGAKCWVAAEVFNGWHHPKTIMARFFVNNVGPKWFKNLYIKYGEKVAQFIHDKPLFKLAIRPLFEYFVACERKAWC